MVDNGTVFGAEFLTDAAPTVYGCVCTDQLSQRMYGDTSTNPNKVTVYINGVRQD